MRHVTKVSVLEAFDPLLLSDEEDLTREMKGVWEILLLSQAFIISIFDFV